MATSDDIHGSLVRLLEAGETDHTNETQSPEQDDDVRTSKGGIRAISHYASRSVEILRSEGAHTLIYAIRRNLRRLKAGVSSASGLSQIAGTATHSTPRPFREDDLVVIAGVPFDDVGGGQRSAQLARCALHTGRRVRYLFVFPKVAFSRPTSAPPEVVHEGLVHHHIDSISPAELLEGLSSRATMLIELPHPKILPFLRLAKVRGVKTVFELIDDWDSTLGGDWYDPEVCRRFVADADVVSGSAEVLVRKLRDLGRADARYVPNGASEYVFDAYKTYARPRDLPRGKRPIGLYFGSLYGDWFAWDYLRAAAEANKDTRFVLIGDNPGKERTPSNVRYLGPRRIDQLPAYLSHADFALLPFVPGKLTEAVSPIKVFEYLFLGKPVVATRLPEIVSYPGVHIADSPQQFAELCRNPGRPSKAHIDTFISTNSWCGRLDHILRDGHVSALDKSVSAIILIHNNMTTIERCLRTLIAHGDRYLREIIVVDNASVDGGAEFVEKCFPSVRVVRNPVNGCSSGRNIGATQARGRILAFFDSDQWFTSSSCFAEALAVLDRQADIGAVGWAAGWFDTSRPEVAGVFVDYCPDRAMTRHAMWRGYRTDIGYLGTGGLFIPRSVFEATGGFDVTYDPTCFEDTDLSFQVKKLGFQLAYRDLVGIRHEPHQTTSASSRNTGYKKLFLRNARYFKRKWERHPQFFVAYPDES